MKIAFIHPDLGIGGAERLVVDAAIALQQLNHEVVIYTSHHDKNHAFDETTDGTLQVKVLGNSVFPRNIAGKFSILFAILRQMHLTQQLISQKADHDVFIIDQLSACIPLLRTHFPKSRILFYCHHPDLVLTDRNSLLKTVYRLPFDNFERWTTSLSDKIAVNSLYTLSIFRETFETGTQLMPKPVVVYPVVEGHPTPSKLVDERTLKLQPLADFKVPNDPRFILSINRFERKKNISLVISAFSLLLHLHEDARQHVLIIAGGYDNRVIENVEHLKELQNLCKKFRIPFKTLFNKDSWAKIDLTETRVLFLPSVDSQLKDYMLQNAALVAYTPTNEHFGIVPLEAMQNKTPVLATNTGGCLETIENDVTGWLEKPNMEDWYRVLRRATHDSTREDLRLMGEKGAERVARNFSLENMKSSLGKLVIETAETERPDELTVRRGIRKTWLMIVVMFIFAICVSYLLFLFIKWIIDTTIKML